VQTFTATRFRLHLVETASIKMSKSQRQAGRKSAAEENGKRREENILRAKREENGTGRRQQFQTAIITPFSAWRSQAHWVCAMPANWIVAATGRCRILRMKSAKD